MTVSLGFRLQSTGIPNINFSEHNFLAAPQLAFQKVMQKMFMLFFGPYPREFMQTPLPARPAKTFICYLSGYPPFSPFLFFCFLPVRPTHAQAILPKILSIWHLRTGLLALSAPKSQRFLRFAIAMPIANPRNLWRFPRQDKVNY